jgi:hypothetical protein
MRHISYTCRLKTLFNKIVLYATLTQLIFLKQPRDLLRPQHHTVVGARHAPVCEVEDSDATPVDQISWCQVVCVPSR